MREQELKKLALDQTIEQAIVAHQAVNGGQLPTLVEVRWNVGGPLRELVPAMKRVLARRRTTQAG